MDDELLKILGTITVTVGGVWVALHRKLENLATRMQAAEKDIEKVESGHRTDVVELKGKIHAAETALMEMRAHHAQSYAEIKNLTLLVSELRTDMKKLLSRG